MRLAVFLSLTAVFIFCACRSSSKDVRSADAAVKWEQKSPETIYTGDKLRDYLKDSAQEFLARGFVRATVAEFEAPGHQKVLIVETYQMKDANGAKTIYNERKSESGKAVTVGEEAMLYEGGLFLIEAVKGDKYFRIFTYDNSQGVKQSLLSVAAKVVPKK